MSGGIKVFISYAHEDREHRDKLLTQLTGLRRRGAIAAWEDGQIEPGGDWRAAIGSALSECDLAILLVSDDFLASEFIYSEELARLFDRVETDGIRLCPIIVRACAWRLERIGRLQVLPEGGQPITMFSEDAGERDQAWTDVTLRLASLIEDLTGRGEPDEGQNERLVVARDPQPTVGSIPPGGGERADPVARHAPPARARESMEAHYAGVVRAIRRGRLVLFLGPGANSAGPGASPRWQAGTSAGPPTADELASHLAESGLLARTGADDVARVAQRVALNDGTGPLYDDLREVYDADFEVPALHREIAALPSVLRRLEYPLPCPLIVTMNVDDLMERAFAELPEPVDVVHYAADGRWQGRFVHRSPDGEVAVINRPNEYSAIAVGETPVVLKLQGTVDRERNADDSFVITEDDHIGYLTGGDLTAVMPTSIVNRLRRGHVLFLGHDQGLWASRVALHRIWGRSPFRAKSWAINPRFGPLEAKLWEQRDVAQIERDALDYVRGLVHRLATTPPDST